MTGSPNGPAEMGAARTSSAARDVSAELAFLTRALKAPSLREAIPRLAERARESSWTFEEFGLRARLGALGGRVRGLGL